MKDTDKEISSWKLGFDEYADAVIRIKEIYKKADDRELNNQEAETIARLVIQLLEFGRHEVKFKSIKFSKIPRNMSYFMKPQGGKYYLASTKLKKYYCQITSEGYPGSFHITSTDHKLLAEGICNTNNSSSGYDFPLSIQFSNNWYARRITEALTGDDSLDADI